MTTGGDSVRMQSMNRDERYTALLRQEVVPAVGCTEPIAVALACAKAREALGFEAEDFEKIELILSRNIIKNALGVGIPGTGMAGIPIAAAMGCTGGDPDKGLEVIAEVSEDGVTRAKKLVNRRIIVISRYEGHEKLYVEAVITAGGHQASVIIKNSHTDVHRIVKDGQTVMEKPIAPADEETLFEVKTQSLEDVFAFAMESDLAPLGFILEGARMNRAAAQEGLTGDYGLRVGKSIRRNVERSILSDNLMTYAVELTSAAADARMAGCILPVMTNSGSGNQGITVSLPVAAVAEKTGADQEKLHRALVLSNLAAVHAKQGMGRLTALCGAITAGIGAASGIAFLLGGTLAHVYKAVQNMIGDLTGMVCDGAKDGCALKVATVVEAAFRSALLALDDIEISGEKGINECDVEKSLKNLARIGGAGMEETDRIILDIMVSKGGEGPGI